MASAVLAFPPAPRSTLDYSLSRSSTPKPSTPPRMPSRPATPRTPPPSLLPFALTHQLSQPISAPQTPVTATHILGMERCRSSEPVLGNPFAPSRDKAREHKAEVGRGGRARDVKATSLLFKTVPSVEQIQSTEKGEWHHIEGQTPKPEEDMRMDIDGEEDNGPSVRQEEEQEPIVWGMPKWGCENERGGEVRKGVRLVGMEELPGLIEQHSNIDTPSHVLFPWLHGICDDGQKGTDMAAFFGYGPPFQPPPYRGLSLMLVGPQIISSIEQKRKPKNPLKDRITPLSQPVTVDYAPAFDRPEPRERSDTMSTSSESWQSCGTHPASESPLTPTTPQDEGAADVKMHPCESKRLSPAAADCQDEKQARDDSKTWVPLYGGPPVYAEDTDNNAESVPELTSDSSESFEDQGPSCILLNALHVQDVFDMPNIGTGRRYIGEPRFRPARLPGAINLRNLNIQQIKYSTISDIILYAKSGVTDGLLEVAEMVAQAQENLYQFRMEDYYQHVADGSAQEGIDMPVKYGVWCIVEPFHKLEKFCPHLVNLDSNGNPTFNSSLTDLFEREAYESRAMTRGSEVVEGFWVGNNCDVPRESEDGLGAEMSFDLCVSCVEGSEMPSTTLLNQTYRRLADLDKRRSRIEEEKPSWIASPATVALRNLLSPATTPPALPSTEVPSKRGASPLEEHNRSRRARCDEEYIPLVCSGSGRPFNGPHRNLNILAEKFVEFIYFLRKVIEGRDKTGVKRQVLVHCQDGYTESSILVLGYIMSSLSISLPEAYLHLQNTAQRSFFLYPNDKPFLKKIDARLTADRKAKALRLVNTSASVPTTPTSPIGNLSRWKSWTLGLNKGESTSATSTTDNGSTSANGGKRLTVQAARELLANEEQGGSEAARKAKVWFEDKRFDGFPSRILPFLYLGNLEHAGNAGMLEALGITHVVSVGETLISCPLDCDPMYGKIGPNALANAYHNGKIKVMDILAIRDDGNDPLRPTIAHACEWIEKARLDGGKVLVHCRVGVSRSASIVIAYMMQHLHMSLMDAYLITRARRLNVLIQPNLRFFHELFGWEVELARREDDDKRRLRELGQVQVQTQEEEGNTDSPGGVKKREIMYSWPSFCRDLYCLNRRFLCN